MNLITVKISGVKKWKRSRNHRTCVPKAIFNGRTSFCPRCFASLPVTLFPFRCRIGVAVCSIRSSCAINKSIRQKRLTMKTRLKETPVAIKTYIEKVSRFFKPPFHRKKI